MQWQLKQALWESEMAGISETFSRTRETFVFRNMWSTSLRGELTRSLPTTLNIIDTLVHPHPSFSSTSRTQTSGATDASDVTIPHVVNVDTWVKRYNILIVSFTGFQFGERGSMRTNRVGTNMINPTWRFYKEYIITCLQTFSDFSNNTLKTYFIIKNTQKDFRRVSYKRE